MKRRQVSWLAKLTPKKVREIRALALEGWGPCALARKFKSSQTAISHLLAGKTYRKVV